MLPNHPKSPGESVHKVSLALEFAGAIRIRTLLFLLLGCLVAACVSEEDPTTPYCGYEGKGPECEWDPESAAFEDAVLELINGIRAEGRECADGEFFPPTNPLTMDEALRWAARFHSKDMQEGSYFDHESPGGRRFVERSAHQRYAGTAVSENIAAGYPTPEQVVEGWAGSEGHCKNMMPDSNEYGGIDQAGIGFFPGAGSASEGGPINLTTMVGGHSSEY